MIYFLPIVLLILLLFIFWQGSLLYASIFHVPTVYAYDQAIEDAFRLANLKKGELVVDLGCGNGKSLIIAAKKFQAKGIGVENSLYCYLKSKLNLFLSGARGVKIIFGDFVKAKEELLEADVVYLYLFDSVLKKIEPWLFDNTKEDVRIVSLCFSFADHLPSKHVTTLNLRKKSDLKLYQKN